MKKSINVTLNTRKKKIFAFVLSGTLILSLGSGVAYAASGADTVFPNGLSVIAKADNGNGTIIEDIEVRAVSDDDGVSVKASVRANEDGTQSYSTDGGKTWSKEIPEGLENVKGITATAKADNGNGTVIEDVEARALSDDDGVSVRASVRANEDGTLSYSTDGGKTWSKEVPEGLEDFTFSVNQDGSGASGKIGN